ncbi:hypothetical protein P9990_17555 [Prescottella equi]|uniref:hypothetical protein n=1 Tax=Rhodococcus hoagii TaxID=43767 RepID=UPI002577B73C|nr:hypothetical protein [Prescottella equi]WJJ10378.1 hypothetical protein P9990_17555 [Prescottella equi]
MSNPPPHELLARAWKASSGDSLSDQLSRMSLSMSAQQRPDLVPTLRALQASHQTELDLHLDGISVQGHSTAAESFGRFITRTAIAVKEIAKSRLDRLQYPANLQILAPTPGSVRVVFRSPAPPEETEEGFTPADEVDSIEGQALSIVAELVALARDAGPNDAELETSLRRLHGGARNAVRLMAQAVVDGQWEISGELRRGSGRRTSVAISSATAERLARAASELTGQVEPGKAIDGKVDGWLWSEGQMTFLPAIGRSFKAAVPGHLQSNVLRFLESKQGVTGVFTVTTTFPPGDDRAATRKYELTGISEVETAPTLDYGTASDESEPS